MLGGEGAGHCAGCLLVCARIRGSKLLCWVSLMVVREEGAGRCAGFLLVCARGKGSSSLC